MKILICGSRDWTNKKLIKQHLEIIPNWWDTTIIHGNCRGADKLAGEVAKKLGFNVVAVPADWKKYGKAAGPIRNQKMLEVGPDFVICFHNDLENSKGSKDMVNRARETGLTVDVVKEKKWNSAVVKR